MDEDKGHGYRDGNRYTDVLIIDMLIMDTDTRHGRGHGHERFCVELCLWHPLLPLASWEVVIIVIIATGTYRQNPLVRL